MQKFNFLTNIKKNYKHGFRIKIGKENFYANLNYNTICLINKKRKEPAYFKNFRLTAFKRWQKLKFPKWATLILKDINFHSVGYYSIFKKKINKKKISPNLIKMFFKLDIELLKKKIDNAVIAYDVIFDHVSIKTTYKNKLAKKGIIFCPITESLKKFYDLTIFFLGSIISSDDNYFACLNSMVFSDGSFCYIPQNTLCPIELSTYFRLNDKSIGQFERTLIVCEKNSSVNYLEGCTASQHFENQLHAAVVELILFKNSNIKYSTIQNWSSGNKKGLGGIYNLVTKRSLCLGKNSIVTWMQVETGSSITWKYPSCILLGKKSKGEFYSIALTKNYQQADTGTKMIHIGEKTLSKIISKGISSHYSVNNYRGLIKVSLNAKHSRNLSQCDSFILGSFSLVSTYPYIDTFSCTTIMEHEAQVSKLSEDQLFYLRQRGIFFELAVSLLINIFCKEILNILPVEFAVEVNKLLIVK